MISNLTLTTLYWRHDLLLPIMRRLREQIVQLGKNGTWRAIHESIKNEFCSIVNRFNGFIGKMTQAARDRVKNGVEAQSI